ncbi:MAG TPA: SLC13 family permease, partial [Steroidobacteraceae bacterium]|nr:SLC13 family permease [Steroidobacteraceae bacterium]
MDTALALTTDMKLVLGLVAFTMAMFLFERIRADVVALVVLMLLGLTRLVAPEELFNGFASNAVISVMATMILGAGLDRTGALNRLAGWLLRRAHGMEKRLLLLTTAISGLNSPLMQSPAVMALYMPVASRLSSRTGLPLSRFLLPLAAAIIMGSSLTMVGSSPLLMLNDLLVSANGNLPSGVATLQPLKMFAPLPIGIAVLATCLLYFHFFGDKLLESEVDESGVTPARTQSYFAKTYGIDGDVYELTVSADSPLVGMSIAEAEALRGAPLLLALKTGNESRL